jgi:histidinol-phosphate/aromatic aminotransferase/cobyric acid decarboxylase-like protein
MSNHGGINPWALQEAGIDPDDVKDFSVSINPARLPDSILDVIASSALYRYPDSRSRVLVEALSAEYGPPPEEIMVVNGTSQGIFLIAGAFLSPGDTTLIAGPAYSEYRDAALVSGARVVEHRAAEGADFRPDTQGLSARIMSEKPKVFWLCSPNNPTGSWINKLELAELAQVCRENGCLMVFDEAYRCFAPPGLLPEMNLNGVVHLHSMTKDFCIPGLRLGWLRADAGVIEKLIFRQPEWSVSAPAQDAGVACLGKLDYFRESWRETRRLTDSMAAQVAALGLKVFPSAANFILVKIGGDAAVKHLSEELWKELFLVRDCASFDLKGFIRLGTRSAQDIEALVDAMRRAL